MPVGLVKFAIVLFLNLFTVHCEVNFTQVILWLFSVLQFSLTTKF